jgi:hypothetical protein
MPTIQFENVPLGPEEIRPMTAAYKEVLRTLGLRVRDPRAEVIAKKIVELVQTGENDPALIASRALLELGVSTPSKMRRRA